MRIENVVQRGILERIQGEFIEMPGLRLTPAQAQRLWGLDPGTCEKLLDALVRNQFLLQTRDGSFMRTDGGSKRASRSNAA